MPRYKVDINRIIQIEDAQAMMEKTRSDPVPATRKRDQFLIAILYFSGARPGEILMLKKEDLIIESGKLVIKLHTEKLGKTGKFIIRDRLLTMSPDMPFYDVIVSYWETSHPGRLIDLTERRIQQIVTKLSDGKFCPYNFRHSRMTKLARQGASIDQLMYWKGAAKADSVSNYLRGKKVEFSRIE